MLRQVVSGLAVSFAALSSLPVQAGLVSLNFNGTVGGYFSLPILEDDFPLGTPISMALTYDDSFIGRPATDYFLGMSPSVSGTMDLAGNHYTFTSMALSFFSYGATGNDPSPNFGFHVKGTGPATDDGEVFSGIGLLFNASSLGAPWLIGFGNVNWATADNGYMLPVGTTTHERLASPVPAPGTWALVLAGLGAWSLTRRPRNRALDS